MAGQWVGGWAVPKVGERDEKMAETRAGDSAEKSAVATAVSSVASLVGESVARLVAASAVLWVG